MSDGGYVTRGRAGEIEQMIAELRGELLERMRQLEDRVDHAEGTAMRVVKAQAAAVLEVYNDVKNGSAPTTTRRDTGHG